MNDEDYLEADGHLKKSGNVKIAKFTKNILETIITIKSHWAKILSVTVVLKRW